MKLKNNSYYKHKKYEIVKIVEHYSACFDSLNVQFEHNRCQMVEAESAKSSSDGGAASRAASAEPQARMSQSPARP